jgi:hypothetical protein
MGEDASPSAEAQAVRLTQLSVMQSILKLFLAACRGNDL